MRILYLAPHEPWPLNTGARLRDYHLARELARRASVTFAGVRNETDPPSPCPPPESGFERIVMLTKSRSYTVGKILRGMAGPVPIPVLNFESDNLRRQLINVLEEGEFDSVQIEGIQFALYLDLIRNAASRPLMISDWHNVESEIMWRYADNSSLPRRLVARRTAALLERVEKQLLEGCHACTVASEREQEKVRKMFGSYEMVVVPNGIATGDYGEAEIRAASAEFPISIEQPYVLFVGSMDYHANIDGIVWFVRETWPALRQRVPALKLVIAGRNPSPNVRSLQGPDVVVTGTVADVRPYYAGASAVVAPLRIGSGTRLKILEAMAAGVPVISTALGAEGIEVTPGEDILFAETAGEFTAAVERILKSRELAVSISAAAKHLVEEHYAWPAIGERLFAVHANLVAQNGSLTGRPRL